MYRGEREKGPSNQGSRDRVLILILQWERTVWSRNTSLVSISFITGWEPEFQSLSFIERKCKNPWATTEKRVYSESTSTSAVELKDGHSLTFGSLGIKGGAAPEPWSIRRTTTQGSVHRYQMADSAVKRLLSLHNI